MRKLFLFIILLGATLPAVCQEHATDSIWMYRNYIKKEFYINMRDGKRLFTSMYVPRNNKEKHPILINRTPYSVGPYGEKAFKANWNTHYMAYARRNYILVMQDVRGRNMSEGTFMDVRPYNPDKKGKETDEASDTWDTIDWLVKNVAHNNGNVGMYGISYPGFYATMGALSGHPALRAVSPQAPVTEWFIGDDFHHNGAFMEQDAFKFYSAFGKPRPKPTTLQATGFKYYTTDNYKFYLEAGPLAHLAELMGDSVKFWRELYAHPNYDEWWQERNARKYVSHIPVGTATLVVGGEYDAEDCYGAWNLYRAIEKKAHNDNKLVMGPWSHGGWARTTGEYLGNVRFGARNSKWYQDNIEIPFFDYYLRGKGSLDKIKEANIFFSGSNEWATFSQWPPQEKQDKELYLQTDGGLAWTAPGGHDRYAYNEYTSDPEKPVPYTDGVLQRRTNEYMTDDQRFASHRTDVLTFTSGILNKDLKLAGPIYADLFASISTTDADFIVKVIDVFPDDFSYKDSVDGKGNGKEYPMGGYEMLVRGEVMRGRYRHSFEEPEAFEPGRISEVRYKLPDVAHVFKRGHKIMIQVQSTWFPLVDRNPQQFVDIYNCDKQDFVPTDIRIYSSAEHPSGVILPVVE